MSFLLMGVTFIIGMLSGLVIMALCAASGHGRENEER